MQARVAGKVITRVGLWRKVHCWPQGCAENKARHKTMLRPHDVARYRLARGGRGRLPGVPG